MEKELNQLHIQVALSIAHSNTIEDALLGVLKELLPTEEWKAVALNFYETLYERSDKCLQKLSGIVPEIQLAKAGLDALEYKNEMLRQLSD